MIERKQMAQAAWPDLGGGARPGGGGGEGAGGEEAKSPTHDQYNGFFEEHGEQIRI